MKNLSLIINAILAVAIAVLFYFQFADSKPKARQNTVDAAVIDSVSSKLKIAFVNQDSLLANYKLIDDLEAELEIERKKSEAKVQRRTTTLESEMQQMMAQYQNKVAVLQNQGAGMNETIRNMKLEELASMEEELQRFQMQANQDVLQMKEQEENRLYEREAEGTKQVAENMKAYIKEYNKEYGFSFVLGFSDLAGGILYGNPALDITKDVVDGLNEIYEAEKAAKAEAEGKKK